MASEIKQCSTCKYEHCSIFVNPCRSCLISVTNRSKWEGREEVNTDEFITLSSDILVNEDE